jgi:membrane-bound lytic murein transglycosylase A
VIKRKYLLLVLILMIIPVLVYIVSLFRKPPPPVWTIENSLSPVLNPDIKDQKDRESLIQAINNSLDYLNEKKPDTIHHFGKNQVSNQHLKDSLLDFKEKLLEWGLSQQFYQYVEQNFHFYQSSVKEVLFTGYFEAHLKGSLQQSETYRFPLYRKPDDLIRIQLDQFPIYEKYKGLPRILKGRFSEDKQVLPYFSRQEIDSQKKLAGKNLEIVWTDDIIDVFFLHIQGSGVVTLDSGEMFRVNYAESNGHPYRAIGRLLINRGILTYETMSMQSIKHYLQTHPQELEAIFNYNPSYVFFREVKKGPLGSINVPLIPYRSIATDKYLFPRGALCYIDTELPDFEARNAAMPHLKVSKWKKLRGFVLNQDSGGAIRGPGRVDLYTGFGEKSEYEAGHLKQKGSLYFLVKKDLKPL